MSTSIKVIHFTKTMSILLGIITYIISLNISYGWFDIKWISNSFLLTIIGGAFASMLVVLICEIQKYYFTKKLTEDQIFSHTGYIYAQLWVIKHQIQYILSNPQEIVPTTLLALPTAYLKSEISVLSGIDYCTLSNKNSLASDYCDFCKTDLGELIQFANYENYLQIAVNTDQIENLKQYGYEGRISSASPSTNATLLKLNAVVDPLIAKTDLMLQKIDKFCDHRYRWDSRKTLIHQSQNDFLHHSFDDFIRDSTTE